VQINKCHFFVINNMSQKFASATTVLWKTFVGLQKN